MKIKALKDTTDWKRFRKEYLLLKYILLIILVKNETDVSYHFIRFLYKKGSYSCKKR